MSMISLVFFFFFFGIVSLGVPQLYLMLLSLMSNIFHFD